MTELVVRTGGGVSAITVAGGVLESECTTVKQSIEMIPVMNAGKRENIFDSGVCIEHKYFACIVFSRLQY